MKFFFCVIAILLLLLPATVSEKISHPNDLIAAMQKK